MITVHQQDFLKILPLLMEIKYTPIKISKIQMMEVQIAQAQIIKIQTIKAMEIISLIIKEAKMEINLKTATQHL